MSIEWGILIYGMAFTAALIAFLNMQWVLKKKDGSAITLLKGYAYFTLVLVVIMGSEVLLHAIEKHSSALSTLFGVIITLSLYFLITRPATKFSTEHGFEISKFALFDYFKLECPKSIKWNLHTLIAYSLVFIVLSLMHLADTTVMENEIQYLYVSNFVSSFILFCLGVIFLSFECPNIRPAYKLFGGGITTLSFMLLVVSNTAIDAVTSGIDPDSTFAHYPIIIMLVIIYMLSLGIREVGNK